MLLSEVMYVTSDAPFDNGIFVINVLADSPPPRIVKPPAPMLMPVPLASLLSMMRIIYLVAAVPT